MNNPEYTINKEFFYVLSHIKELSLKTPTHKPIKYWINYLFVAPGIPSGKDQQLILEKLEEMEAIKILNSGGTGEYE